MKEVTLVAAGAIAAVVILVILATSAAGQVIARDCKRFGAFYIDSVRYECRPA